LNFARQLPNALSGMPCASQYLPLIQVAMPPRLMMCTPERLTLTHPRSMLIRHLVLSICKSTARTDRVCQLQNKGARNQRLPCFSVLTSKIPDT
jgi:hypothetical protein